jgi:hypothetical protein
MGDWYSGCENVQNDAPKCLRTDDVRPVGDSGPAFALIGQPAWGVHLAPRNEITNSQGVEEFDEHLLAVDALWEASLPDFDR